MRRALALVAPLLLGGCIDYLGPGQPGELRYFGEVLGQAPLRLVPPVSDRAGDVYVLYGAPDLNQAKVYVGAAAGGFSAGCAGQKGDARGTHGFVGRGEARAWYWAGEGLIAVQADGSCAPVLDLDPASGASLGFRAVVPLVAESPSRTTVPALIQSPTDRVPFHVLVDLDHGRYDGARAFAPADATDLVVLGVGADAAHEVAVEVVRYATGGAVHVVAIFLDRDDLEVGRAPLTGLDDAAEDSILGFTSSVDGDHFVGLMDDRTLVAFDRHGGGRRVASSAFTPIGVHAFAGQLYLVGIGGGEPAVADLGPGGTVGPAHVWGASTDAAQAMGSHVAVIDERKTPRVRRAWDHAASAIGPWPFLSPFAPDPYADGETGWVFAGPSFSGGGEPQTSVAFAPVGITYR